MCSMDAYLTYVYILAGNGQGLFLSGFWTTNRATVFSSLCQWYLQKKKPFYVIMSNYLLQNYTCIAFLSSSWVSPGWIDLWLIINSLALFRNKYTVSCGQGELQLIHGYFGGTFLRDRERKRWEGYFQCYTDRLLGHKKLQNIFLGNIPAAKSTRHSVVLLSLSDHIQTSSPVGVIRKRIVTFCIYSTQQITFWLYFRNIHRHVFHLRGKSEGISTSRKMSPGSTWVGNS